MGPKCSRKYLYQNDAEGDVRKRQRRRDYRGRDSSEVTTSQGTLTATGGQTGKNGPFPRAWGTTAADTSIFTPGTLTSDSRLPGLQEKTFLRFQATKFVIIGLFFFLSHRKLNTNTEFYGDQIGTEILTRSRNPHAHGRGLRESVLETLSSRPPPRRQDRRPDETWVVGTQRPGWGPRLQTRRWPVVRPGPHVSCG